MMDKFLMVFLATWNDGFLFKSYLPGDPHMVGGLTRHKNGGNKNVSLLCNEFTTLHPIEKISTDRKVVTVLLQGTQWNNYHIRSCEQVFYLWHGHVRQIILYLLLRPQGVGLGVCNKTKCTEGDDQGKRFFHGCLNFRLCGLFLCDFLAYQFTNHCWFYTVVFVFRRTGISE